MVFFNLAQYLLAFIFLWIGSGFIVSSVDSFSKRLRLSSFAISFIILGLLTSAPEFAVGLSAVSDNNPEIFVGNLIGGIPVIFLLVIPILAIFGNGVRIKQELEKGDIFVILSSILAPSFVILDRRVTDIEGVLLIFLYFAVLYLINKRYSILNKEHIEVFQTKAYSLKDIVKLVLGVGVVFIAGSIIVEKTVYFAEYFHISLFFISLIVLSIGTNLPELSIAVRSVISKKKDVALGDYLGSATANTLLFGIFTLLSKTEVLAGHRFLVTFYYTLLGLGLFYFFSRSKSAISRKEGFALLFAYLIFVLLEFWG